MPILTASNVGQSFGPLDLFSNLSVSVPNDGKIGLVGPNGVGKTTLLLILAGLSKPAAGAVHWARGARIGYLPQESADAFGGPDHSVYEEMLAVFAGLREAEQRLRQMEAEMAAGDASAGLLERYGSALEQFEHAGGYDYEVRIQQVLAGLGLGAAEWQLKLTHLSGGQKTRALLARLLLEEPDLLILDEPTNHLDVEAIEWLENRLRVWEGALVLVSHDRYFLDKAVNTIWEMSSAAVETYRGNYSAYVQQRRERWALRQQAFAARKERLEKELDYIRRHIAGQRTQMAKGRLSRISRELDSIQRGGLEAVEGKSWSELSSELETSRHTMDVAEAAAAIRALRPPNDRPPTFNVHLKAGRRSGELVLRTNDVVIGFPGKPLFAAEDIELRRQECAALIGPNGSGKTTFLRTILGQMEPLAGEVRPGASLEIGYLAQAHEGLDLENPLVEELMRHHPMGMADARNTLARYLFRQDDVFKRVGDLSGGERGRLALAILALKGANFLLLDEPTNHLDVPAQEMLQEVLEQFEGTILLVSHDRYLVDRLATQLWYLERGRLRVFKGPYQEYLAERDRQAEVAKEAAASRRAPETRNGRPGGKSDVAARQRASRLGELEHEIGRAEARLEEIGRALQAGAAAEAFDRIQSLGLEYAAAERHLEGLLAEWEDLAREQTLA